MRSGARAIGAFFDTLFELPVERWIAWARLALAGIGLAGCAFAPPSNELTVITLILFVYLFYASAIVFNSRREAFTTARKLLIHGVDIGVSSALMVLSDAPTSPFFVFFIFIVLSGALRWYWRGAVLSALTVALVWIGLYWIDVGPFRAPERPRELGAALIRGSILIVCGALLAYVGAYQERNRSRFAALARWPAPAHPDESGSPGLAEALAHAAKVMRASRVLIVWEQSHEPYLYVSLWSEGEFHRSLERNDVFGTIVAPGLANQAFVFIAETGHRTRNAVVEPLDPSLRRTFRIESTATAPFRLRSCQGRVFMLDRETWREDDLPLMEIIAARLGIEIEDQLLRGAVADAIAERERGRLGHDLHDGVLQGLAAASLHLKIVSDESPEPSREKIKKVRELLGAETQRLRGFVEERRSRPKVDGGIVELEPQLAARIAQLKTQWNCAIDFNIQPADVLTSASAARDVRHIITEAVSNAVRHGQATHIGIDVERSSDRLMVRIRDNGSGFEGLAGSYREADLAAKNIGPRSLRSRVNDLAGSIFLTSSPDGSEITIEVPA
jgi:signal transduction histidine kinase